MAAPWGGACKDGATGGDACGRVVAFRGHIGVGPGGEGGRCKEGSLGLRLEKR